MCKDAKLKLIPIVIIITAIVSALIFSFVNFGIFIPAYTIYPYSLAASLLILLVTGVLIFICGLRSSCTEKISPSCGAVSCFGPVILFAAAASVIISSIGAAGLDFSAIPVYGAVLNITFGLISALFLSTTIVYFVGMFYFILDLRR